MRGGLNTGDLGSDLSERHQEEQIASGTIRQFGRSGAQVTLTQAADVYPRS